jgi:hypothetical protein
MKDTDILTDATLLSVGEKGFTAATGPAFQGQQQVVEPADPPPLRPMEQAAREFAWEAIVRDRQLSADLTVAEGCRRVLRAIERAG